MNKSAHIFLLVSVPAALGLAWGGMIYSAGESWEQVSETYVPEPPVTYTVPSNYIPSYNEEQAAAAAAQQGDVSPIYADQTPDPTLTMEEALRPVWQEWKSLGHVAQLCALIDEANVHGDDGETDSRWWAKLSELAPVATLVPDAKATAWGWLWYECAINRV